MHSITLNQNWKKVRVTLDPPQKGPSRKGKKPIVFVLEVVPPQRRVPPFFDKNPPKIDVVLYPTYFIPLPLLRTTFPPFPRPLWVASAHPERTGAALGSPKANAALA